MLVDILTKREYLYRQYFLNKGLVVYLPKYLTTSPNNILLQEVKAVYPLTDPSIFSTEITREYLYKNLVFHQFKLFKEVFGILNNVNAAIPLNLNILFEYFYFYYFNTVSNVKLGNSIDFYKNQYRPLKKGIINMIRLHATGAIAMPSEIRLHILASSKDVIHS